MSKIQKRKNPEGLWDSPPGELVIIGVSVYAASNAYSLIPNSSPNYVKFLTAYIPLAVSIVLKSTHSSSKYINQSLVAFGCANLALLLQDLKKDRPGLFIRNK